MGLLVIMLCLTAPTWADGTPSRPVPPALRSGTLPQVQLYEAAGDHVQAFALDSNGLPATQPDRQLYGGFSAAFSIALDAAGYIYVADYGGSVKVFAPGSSGNATPLYVIPMIAPTWVALNKAGYLFVTCCSYNEVLVFERAREARLHSRY